MTTRPDPGGAGRAGTLRDERLDISLDRFLAHVELRALEIAKLSCPHTSDALARLELAMSRFVREDPASAATDWPVRFWRRLDTCLFESAARSETNVAHDDADDSSAALRETQGAEQARPAEDAFTRVEAALRSLTLPQRQAFLFRVWEGFDVARTAAVMQLPEDNIRRLLFESMQMLRERIDPARSRDLPPAPASASSTGEGAAWVLRVRVLLEQAVREQARSLQPALADLRRRVLAQPATPAPSRWPLHAAGLAAAACMIWIVLASLPPSDQSVPAPAPAASLPDPPFEVRSAAAAVDPALISAPDFDLLVDVEPEVVLEDLAFYAWLAETEADAQ